MALKDGMLAISKTLKVIAIGSLMSLIGMGIYAVTANGRESDSFLGAVFIGVFLFFLFWTPAWIIKKFAK